MHVLETYFHKTGDEAQKLMLTVHLQGKASVGLYFKDIGETKAHHVMQYARENGMRLEVEWALFAINFVLLYDKNNSREFIYGYCKKSQL